MKATALDLLREGVVVIPVLGDFSPLGAIRDEMYRRSYDSIVISTLPGRVSRWLRVDLPARVAREFDVQVTQVQPGAEPLVRTTALSHASAA